MAEALGGRTVSEHLYSAPRRTCCRRYRILCHEVLCRRQSLMEVQSAVHGGPRSIGHRLGPGFPASRYESRTVHAPVPPPQSVPIPEPVHGNARRPLFWGQSAVEGGSRVIRHKCRIAGPKSGRPHTPGVCPPHLIYAVARRRTSAAELWAGACGSLHSIGPGFQRRCELTIERNSQCHCRGHSSAGRAGCWRNSLQWADICVGFVRTCVYGTWRVCSAYGVCACKGMRTRLWRACVETLRMVHPREWSAGCVRCAHRVYAVRRRSAVCVPPRTPLPIDAAQATGAPPKPGLPIAVTERRWPRVKRLKGGV